MKFAKFLSSFWGILSFILIDIVVKLVILLVLTFFNYVVRYL